MASIRHTVHGAYCTHRTIHWRTCDTDDNPTRCRRLYDLHLCIQRTLHVAQFTGGHATHCARSYDMRISNVRIVHVAKPDDV